MISKRKENMLDNLPKLSLVVPCFNESSVLLISNKLFEKKINTLILNKKISDKSNILYVDDGSEDDTWSIIQGISMRNKLVKGIRLSRNMGHQNALLAGLFEVKDYCDICISIDADGQDDVNAIDKMIDKYCEGNEIVYGVRSDRSTDSFLKRFTAEIYYKLINFLGGNIIFNHADYRLISNKVLDSLSQFNETNLFLRGTFPLIGYKYDIVEYKRNERLAGKSHYPISKMLALALNGITNLSIKPLRIILTLGIAVSFLSFIGVIWSYICKIRNYTVSGWASITCIICFVSGIQLISLGIIGEYIGKIYMETKHRPKFIISEKTKNE